MSATSTPGFGTETLRQDFHETVRQLNAALGPTLVAYLSGSKDQKASIRWARVDGGRPRSHAVEARILDAHRAWRLIVAAHNEYTARNWFIAANPRLDEEAPVECLRAGGNRAVLKAATAFADDGLA